MASASRSVITAVSGLALLVPVVADARPVDGVQSAQKSPVRLLSINSPTQAVAGEKVTISARIHNNSSRVARPRLTIRLSSAGKSNSAGRLLAAKRLSSLKASHSKRYAIKVRLPQSLPQGSYQLSVCVRLATGRASCRSARRPLTITNRSSSSSSSGSTVGTSSTNADKDDGKDDGKDKRYDVLVLTESRPPTDAHSSTAAGVEALKDAGKSGDFKVTVAAQSAGAFTEASLEGYRTVVFLNTSGNILSDNEQAAFEHYFQQGGGFVAIHSAIATEPSWPFMNNLLGTRAAGAESAPGAATIKVADRVHDASKSLPEYWAHADGYYNFVANVRGLQHVLATVDEKTYTGGTMGADHPVAWCQDLDGGRSFYTAVGHTAASFADTNVAEHLAGAIKWAAGRSDPVYSDCGATVLANYKQVKISAPPNLNEPIGFDQLPDGRVIQTARAGQRAPARPGRRHHHDARHDPGLHATARTGCTARPWTTTSRRTSGCTSTTRRRPSRTSSSPTGRSRRRSRRSRRHRADVGPGAERVGSVRRLLPAVEVQVRGGDSREPGSPRPGQRAEDPARLEQPRRVLPRRGRHRLRLRTTTSGSSPATTRRPAAVTPAASHPHNDHEDRRVPDRSRQRRDRRHVHAHVRRPDDRPDRLQRDGGAPAGRPRGAEQRRPRRRVRHRRRRSTRRTRRVTVRSTRYAQQNVAADDGRRDGADGHGPGGRRSSRPSRPTCYVAPYVDARRSAMNTNDLRGKVLRIKVSDDGSYTVPSGNLFAPGTPKRGPRSTRWASGTPSGSRSIATASRT